MRTLLEPTVPKLVFNWILIMCLGCTSSSERVAAPPPHAERAAPQTIEPVLPEDEP